MIDKLNMDSQTGENHSQEDEDKTESVVDSINDPSTKFGKLLAHPKPGDEVVISGIAGTFPESENVGQFRDNLLNKVDMVTDDNRRWEPCHPEIPRRSGKLPNIADFDAGYFGVHHRQATTMDPSLRLILEKIMESITDAGLHPSDLEGTNTGVFVGSSYSETEITWFRDTLVPHGYALTGCLRSMLAQRISYFLKLKGPSYICDTACSSSLFALENAYKAIRTGLCDRAIVGGVNLVLHPYSTLQFARLGVLSLEGKCKSFDNSGNGYVRSEALTTIILQKNKEAKRIYSTILHAKTNCDGFTDSGITFPSRQMQSQLIKRTYEECDFVKFTDLSYLEAHGTGTKVGDAEELQGIEDLMRGRTTPLLIGSVKSNIGHSEPSSGLCSVTKAVIAFETGFIPPNLHYSEPRSNVKSLNDGRLKVVTEKIPFNDNRGLIGLNNFGFGGGNCHVILKHNTKEKVDCGSPKDDIPRLVCVSGRTKEAVDSLLDDVIENHGDSEHVRLLQEAFRKDVVGHNYRGYTLVSKSGKSLKSCSFYNGKTRPLAVCFGFNDNAIAEQSKKNWEIPLAIKTIQRIHEILLPKGPNILTIMYETETDTILERVLRNFALQIIIADIIKALNVVPDKIFAITKGLSLGVLVCAYFDETLSLKEAVECAYAIAYAANSVSENGASNNDELAVLVEKSGRTALQQTLKKIIANPQRLSQRVILDVTPSEISSMYILNCLGCSKGLSYAKSTLKKDFVVYEIGNGYVTEALKNNMDCPDHKFSFNVNGELNELLTSFGRLYELGYNPQIQKLFPEIEFPVSRGTPMISPKIKWNHSRKWCVAQFTCEDIITTEGKEFQISLEDPQYTYTGGHNIDGRNLFPATGYLLLVWETLSYIHGLNSTDMAIVFENCKFRRACTVPKEGKKLRLTVTIQKGSGNFEVVEGDGPVVTGRIRQSSNIEAEFASIALPTKAIQTPDMTTKDIYKELRLRGYKYNGKFRGLKLCDIGGKQGEITWDNNWVTFMDNMLQLNILQEDTRLLYVPTTIRKLTIDAKSHLQYAETFKIEKKDLPVYASKECNVTRSGFIEVKGLNVSSIARKKYLATPVLEKYLFVPNTGTLKTEQAVRINMQILLENLYSIKVKGVELTNGDESATEELQPLGQLIHDVLADQPLIQPNIISHEEKAIELLAEVDCSLVVGSRLLQNPGVLKRVFGLLKDDGFVLSREPMDFNATSCDNKEIIIVTEFATNQEKLIFFKKKCDLKVTTTIRISSEDKQFTWLPTLKNAIENDGSVLIYAQRDKLNGILGLCNCLRRETGGKNVKLVFLSDSSAPDFDLKLPFYQEQLKKNLAVNVFQTGKWGTYRHLLLEQNAQVEVDHCYLNTLNRGDLSSLKWIEGPIKYDSPVNIQSALVSVYYSALNFRDVMTAAGKINVDSVTRDRLQQECIQGFEFSGRTQDGKRVMGIVLKGACASLVNADKYLLWDVPDDWSLEDAATVPVVYATCMYSFFTISTEDTPSNRYLKKDNVCKIVGFHNIQKFSATKRPITYRPFRTRGHMKRGNTVLIHSGTGGVGQAAITLALHTGCTVYTTVGTPEKREFLKKKFPELTDINIANSRDTSFEEHIMKVTEGRGVDIVLNSLAEEKLVASVRCLAREGHFFEIGKFDMANDNTLSLLLLEKHATFHGIMLDGLFNEDLIVKKNLFNILQQGIKNGAVKPLERSVFNLNQPEDVFRYMGSGKHIGKVLLQIRQEEKEKIVKPYQSTFAAIPRYYCHDEKTYIICGGLGGFGLELADWLVFRGCRKLVLTSRNGVKNGYQAYRISIWRSYGCIVQISTDNISTEKGCENLITAATKLGAVHAIFNLAVVLKDALLENQSEESFNISFGPKAYATKWLDIVSRKFCHQLRDFVIFSSVSCGRGNAGQTNYGMANSVMERTCEKRKEEGFPALAIEWGAVGDVGLVADLQDEAIEMEIGGTLQQEISNCIQCMDTFLSQNEAAVVSSIVVAEKRAGSGPSDSMVEAVATILGIKDLKSVSMQSTLAEAGMDSMTAVEIKQVLERDFDVFLSPQHIKGMTFARLMEIEMEKDAENQTVGEGDPVTIEMDMLLFEYMGDTSEINIPVLPIKGKLSDKPYLPTLVLFPGIEGNVRFLEPIYKLLEANLVGLQYPPNSQKNTIEDMALTYLPLIEERICKEEPFFVVCYSFGGLVAFEAVHQLERKGYKATVICIDSSPSYLKEMAKLLGTDSDDEFQVKLLANLLSFTVSQDVILKNMKALMECHDFEGRIKIALSILGTNIMYDPVYYRTTAISLYKRLKDVLNWNPEYKLASKVTLFKPTVPSVKMPNEDYGLSEMCENPVDVKVFDGAHKTILENPEVPEEINKLLGMSKRIC